MDTEILRDFVISLKPTVISAKAKLKAKLCHHIQECFILSKKVKPKRFCSIISKPMHRKQITY